MLGSNNIIILVTCYVNRYYIIVLPVFDDPPWSVVLFMIYYEIANCKN